MHVTRVFGVVKEYAELATFVVAFAAADYFLAGLVCEEYGWSSLVRWLMTAFTVTAFFFWSKVVEFTVGDFFRDVSWQRKIGAALSILVGVAYACAIIFPSIPPHLWIGHAIALPFIVYFTKVCGNITNLTIGFFLSAFFDFQGWMKINREGFRGLRRYN